VKWRYYENCDFNVTYNGQEYSNKQLKSISEQDVDPYSVYAGCPARKIRSYKTLDKSKYKR